jgi:plasmid stabilization system protein ParE
MPQYTIYYTSKAKTEIATLRHYIVDELMTPLTADKYIDGILDKINSLTDIADIFAPSQLEYLQQRYGYYVRTITYKKMTIVYNIIGNIVLVRRVMESSLIL